LTINKIYDIIIIEREIKEIASMNKTLVFDMDGTIVDLYGVENWLADLRAFNPRPYRIAKPIYDTNALNAILLALKSLGWRIVVTSWLSLESTPEYDRQVRFEKIASLDRMGFPYDEIHIVKYGTTKANCTRKLGGYQILVDDNADVRKGWTLGDTINANENIIEKLLELLLAEV
jgi:hypothetical protein